MMSLNKKTYENSTEFSIYFWIIKEKNCYGLKIKIANSKMVPACRSSSNTWVLYREEKQQILMFKDIDELWNKRSDLIDLNDMSICLGLSNAERLGNHVHCTFTFT